MIVIEALKYRYHRGRRSNLYHWRDPRGNEVDLLIENGPNIALAEIKAGATISSDWFKSLEWLSDKLPAAPIARALIYGGSERQTRTRADVWCASDVAEMMTRYHSMPGMAATPD